MADEQKGPPPAEAPADATAEQLREATDAEHRLIERLHSAVAHRLLLEWDDIPRELKVLSMNRALLSALARALGTFLGAVSAADPRNREGWDQLVDLALAIAKDTARLQRDELERQEVARQNGIAWPTVAEPPIYVFPEPKSVM